jgi:6-phosphogluconolactonase (cycloisomerase 2 family)
MSCKAIRSFIGVLFCLLLASRAWADGAVYTMTNSLVANQILVYHRASDGTLSPSTPIQTIATGGGGSGLQLSAVDSLGSAGSLQLDAAHHFLFAINTESASQNNGAGTYNTDCQQGTITSFRIASDGSLTFVDRVFSRGLFPNSLAIAPRGQGQGEGGDGDDQNGDARNGAITKRGHGHGKGSNGNGGGHGNGGGDGNGGDHGNSGKGEVLYVLNAGGPQPTAAVCSLTPGTANGPNITGFSVDSVGNMVPLDSTQPIDPGPPAGSGENCVDAAGFEALTGAPAADFACGLNPPSFIRSPAQIGFTPDGSGLVVTVKGTNTIYVFPVDNHGKIGSPTTSQATLPALPTFFGFTFDQAGDLLVTESFGSATSIPKGGSGAVSSFNITSAGQLLPISSHVGDGGTAACWIALEPVTGKFAYVSNNLSASISSYSVANNGGVTLLNATAAPSSGPNDLATATEGGASFLYAVAAGSGTVGAFQINLTNGSLSALTSGSGFPGTTFPQGLAAF